MPVREDIISLLKERRYHDLLSLPHSRNKIFRNLISLSYDKTSLISWRAIEAAGSLTGVISKADPELVRNFVGRLLWMIRDESGGIGWSAPEMLGEITRNSPELCSDIASIMASFHKETMLTSGVLWALGRIGRTDAGMVNYSVPIILDYLKSSDQTLRGYAAWALGEIRPPGAIHGLEKLRDDKNNFTLYDDGELKEISVGEIASEALAKITGKHKY